MPRINRVRFINYAWRDRRIDDLTLNFRGGMNTEVRLVNGGGKSVLQRLIYQAIHPNTAVSGNQIEDYLKNTPAMTVIEWVLDQPKSGQRPEIITIGVLLSKSNVQDETNTVVHYFTFISNNQKYLSLDKLPNVKNEAGVIMIESYVTSQNQYRNLANNHGEIFYFQSSDKRRYQEKLEDFGLSVRNWKEIILRMISSEDPFKVFLNNSKTEDQLINGYLLPNIEEHISRNGRSKANIRKILLKNAENLAREKDKIGLRDALKSYLEEVKEQDIFLDNIIEAKKREEEAKVELIGFHHALRNHQKALEDEQNILKTKLEETKAQINIIDREERSQEWYLENATLEEAKKNLEQCEAEEKAAETMQKTLNHQKDILMARKIYDEMQSAIGELKGYQGRLLMLEQSDDSRRRLDLSSTLYRLIGAELDRFEKEKTDLGKRKIALNKELLSDEQKLNKEEKRKEELDRETGRLDEKISWLEEKEVDLCESLKTKHKLRRDFLNRLIPEEMTAVKKELDDARIKAEKELRRIKDEINDCNKESDAINDSIENLEIEKVDQRKECEKLNETLKVYINRKEILEGFLGRYGLSSGMLFRREQMKEECDRRKLSNEKETDELKYRLKIQKELKKARMKAASIYQAV